ncbi:MAG: hypothetical protein WC749_12985 [Dehalococcoidia bacterium]
MKDGIKLYEQGIEESPISQIAFGNIMMLGWIAVGTISCWFVHPVIAWVYLTVAFIMVFIVLRKLVCTNCYYYGKRCPIGWGKLSAMLFSQGDIEQFSTCAGTKVAPLTYGLLTLIPLVLCIVALVQEITVARIIVLILLLAISAYSGSIGRKKSCAKCKMKLICPGSASK